MDGIKMCSPCIDTQYKHNMILNTFPWYRSMGFQLLTSVGSVRQMDSCTHTQRHGTISTNANPLLLEQNLPEQPFPNTHRTTT